MRDDLDLVDLEHSMANDAYWAAGVNRHFKPLLSAKSLSLLTTTTSSRVCFYSESLMGSVRVMPRF